MKWIGKACSNEVGSADVEVVEEVLPVVELKAEMPAEPIVLTAAAPVDAPTSLAAWSGLTILRATYFLLILWLSGVKAHILRVGVLVCSLKYPIHLLTPVSGLQGGIIYSKRGIISNKAQDQAGAFGQDQGMCTRFESVGMNIDRG